MKRPSVDALGRVENLSQSKDTTKSISPTEKAGPSDRPFLKIDTLFMREALPFISGGELKVWLAYALRKNRDGEAWPSLKRIAEDTGLSVSRASKLRNALLADGWLTAVGCSRGTHGTFSAPRFRPEISQEHRTLKIAHGESSVRREELAPCAENDAHRTPKIVHEVDALEEEPNKVSGRPGPLPFKRDVETMAEKTVDPTFVEAQQIFRRVVGKGLGTLGKRSTDWSRMVAKFGSKVILASIGRWADEGNEFLRTLIYPLAHFLKHGSEICEAVSREQACANSSDAEDDDFDTDDLVKELRQKANDRKKQAKAS
jgi:hypothetical protein